MSDLTSSEKYKLESLLGMDSGYVLDFSNARFQEFILDNTGLNIEDEKYNYKSGSKANRLRSFWKEESNYIVGRLIEALLERWRTQKLANNVEVNISQQDLFNECAKIFQRLLKEDFENKEQDEIKTKAHFEQIQYKIIEQLKSAKFVIWIAVAWLTDPILFKLLVTKKKEGVNVQLVINDDKNNADSGLNYNELETYKIKEIGRYNRMHNKFCIIDLKTVIHGSYNWTNTARNNKETVTVQHGREITEEFAEEFIKLKRLSTTHSPTS